MIPQPAILLGLGLCLGQLTHQQSGAWPKPSISAEPGLTIPLGQNVTFVCRSPQSFDVFRLQKDSKIVIKDEKNTSLDQTEMRFPMGPVEASMAGWYSCVYLTSQVWSDHSEELELVVTAEEVTQASDSDPALPSGTPAPGPAPGPGPGLLYVFVGVAVVLLLTCLPLLLFCLHRHSQTKHGSPSSKGEGWKPQERLSLDMEDLKTTPDSAKVDRLAGKDAQMDTTVLAAGSGQDVTYAQLDQRALMQRAAPAMEPSAESSTYATLARC